MWFCPEFREQVLAAHGYTPTKPAVEHVALRSGASGWGGVLVKEAHWGGLRTLMFSYEARTLLG